MLILRITLGKIALFCMPKMRFRPRRELISRDASPNPLVSCGEDTPPRPHPTQRLRRSPPLVPHAQAWCPTALRLAMGLAAAICHPHFKLRWVSQPHRIKENGHSELILPTLAVSAYICLLPITLFKIRLKTHLFSSVTG